MRRTWLVALTLCLLGLAVPPASADGTTTEFKGCWTLSSFIKRNVIQGEDAYYTVAAESSQAGHLTVTVTQQSTGSVLLEWAKDTPAVAPAVSNQYEVHVPSTEVGAYTVHLRWDTPFDPSQAGPFTHLTLSPTDETWTYMVDPPATETPEVPTAAAAPLTAATPTAVRVRIAGRPVVGKWLVSKFRLMGDGGEMDLPVGATGRQRWTVGGRTVGRYHDLKVRPRYQGKRVAVTFIVRLPDGSRLTDTAAVRIAAR